MPVIFNTLHWFSSLMLITLSFYCLKKANTKTGYHLCLFLMLLSGWCLIAALTFSIPDIETKIEISKLRFVFIPFLSVNVFFLARCFSDFDKVKWPTLLFLFVIPVITLFVTLSPYHYLMANNYKMETILGSQMLTFDNGSWFPIHIIHARIVFIWALILLGKTSFTNHLIKKTSWILFFSILIPFTIDTLAVSLFPAMRFIQIVPVALSFSAICFYYVVFKEKILQLIPVPIARSMIIDSIQDIYLVLDSRDQLIDFNLHARKTLNLSNDSFSKQLKDIGPDENGIIEHLNVTLWSGQTENELEVKNRSPRVHYSFKVEKIISKNEELMGRVIIIKNISAQKDYERQLTQMLAIRTKFIGIMAHDLIGNVSGHALFLESLRDHHLVLKDEDLKANVDFLMHSSQNVTKFIEGLLLWSRENLEGLQIKKSSADVNHMVSDSLYFLEALSIQKDIEFLIDMPAPLNANVDPDMFQTVLRNVIGNAIKHSKANSKISISAKVVVSHLEISIEDNGPGVDENELNTFLKGMSIDSYKGGLGLTLSRDFINLHGGSIRVKNKEPNGAVFTLTIPDFS